MDRIFHIVNDTSFEIHLVMKVHFKVYIYVTDILMTNVSIRTKKKCFQRNVSNSESEITQPLKIVVKVASYSCPPPLLISTFYFLWKKHYH